MNLPKNSIKLSAVSIFTALTVFIFYYFYIISTANSTLPEIDRSSRFVFENKINIDSTIPNNAIAIRDTENSDLDFLIAIENEFIQTSRTTYYETIHNNHTQAKFIEKITHFLKELYPENWKQEMERMLALVFPDIGDDLYVQYQLFEHYKSMMSKKREAFSNLSNTDRNNATWALREELFGEAAYEIWAAVYKSEQVTTALMHTTSQLDEPVNTRFQNYISAIETTYNNQTTNLLLNKKQEIMDRFLLDSDIQQDLNAMPMEQRSVELRKIREAVGMDTAAIQRWNTLDNKRNDRWQTGKKYMIERSEIETSFSGDIKALKLKELRENLFGEQARSIEAEEDTGHFRFFGEQVHGIN